VDCLDNHVAGAHLFFAPEYSVVEDIPALEVGLLVAVVILLVAIIWIMVTIFR